MHCLSTVPLQLESPLLERPQVEVVIQGLVPARHHCNHPASTRDQTLHARTHSDTETETETEATAAAEAEAEAEAEAA